MKDITNKRLSGPTEQISPDIYAAYLSDDHSFFSTQIDSLLTRGDHDRIVVLLYAIKNARISIVQTCLKRIGSEINLLVMNFTPLTMALSCGNVEITQHLVNHPDIDVNYADAVGNFPLLQVCAIGDQALLLQLLSKLNLEVNRTNDEHVSALASAICHNNVDCASLLLDFGGIEPSCHFEALNWAIRCDNKALVERLLASGFDVNIATPRARLAVGDPSDQAEELQDAGRLPLYWAMSIGSIELCELLLFHGASIKRSDAFGKKLLLSILDDEQIGDFYRLNHQKLVNKRTSNTALTPTKTPLKSNFFPKATISSAKNNNSFTSFSEVIPVVQQRNVDLLEPYLERIGSTEVMLGPNGNTLLHLAVLVPDNVHIIRTLLKREAPIDAVNQRKQTPLLLLAAQPFCSLSNLMCLLENGADVTHQDHFGSALHYAIKFGSLAAIELLLSYNADPTATSISGLKAVDFAFQENATAYKLICNKMDDKQNNQQAMLGHEIIEDTLTTLDGSIKFGSWHIVLMLMDRAIKHQGHYQGYLSLLTEKDVQHSSTIKIFGDLLSEVQGPIVTSFASLGALTAIELALYYKNLCLSYFDYLFDLAPEEELERALVFNLSCLHSPVTPDLRQPDQNHTLNTEIMDDLFTHKIEEIQSKEAKYITHYSERFLADLLIARWRVRCSSTNVERQKQAAADFQQGCEIYQQLVSQCSNLPRKISLLIALHSCKPDDAQVQVEYAKTAVKLNNRNIQASAYRLIFKSDRSISDPVLIAKKLAEIVIQGSSIPYNNHSILDSKNIRSEIK